MAGFTFGLETVLRQRKSAERRQQHEVALVLLRCQALQRRLDELAAQVAAGMEELRQRTLGGVVDVKYVLAQSGYLMGLRGRETALAQELATARTQARAAGDLLTREAQRRRILEKLRETQESRWRQDTSRRQGHEDDDVGARWAAS